MKVERGSAAGWGWGWAMRGNLHGVAKLLLQGAQVACMPPLHLAQWIGLIERAQLRGQGVDLPLHRLEERRAVVGVKCGGGVCGVHGVFR